MPGMKYYMSNMQNMPSKFKKKKFKFDVPNMQKQNSKQLFSDNNNKNYGNILCKLNVLFLFLTYNKH